MKGFTITTPGIQPIRFLFYNEAAPVTVSAFAKMLPFTCLFVHARVSGEEIWVSDAHRLDIIQENASVFTQPGEIVFGPVKPLRTKTSGCIGIYYGEGKGLDCGNIFGKVVDDDLLLLRTLGEKIWKHGEQELIFQLAE